MSSYPLSLGIAVLIIAFASLKLFTRPSLLRIRGPKSPSLVFGNLLELFQRPVGEAEFVWQNLYGNVIRFKGIFGGNQLLVMDQKALQKILNTSGYDYSKLPNHRAMTRMLSGQGIVWAEGESHKRQRKIMLPGFGARETKAFLPIFKECAESISMKWLDSIANSTNGQSAVVNIRALLALGALDAVGQAAFDVQLNTMQDNMHPLAKVYKNVLSDIFGLPTAKQIFMHAASEHIPIWLLGWISDRTSNPRIARARHSKNVVTRIARELVQEKAHALSQGRDNRDILSLLVRANMDADAKDQLTEEELLAQMRSILGSGYETVSTSVTWILLELARDQTARSRLRNEIRKTMAIVQSREDRQLTVADLDEMVYLNAVIKEGLRFHPIVPHIHRMASRDDVLPLSKPILTRSGGKIHEFLVPKGTHVVISIAAYHRDKDLWGEDSHKFNVDRWLNGSVDEKKLSGIGVYANLLTFLSGTRACIGWRFAILEIQAFLLEFVGKFDFTTVDATERILRQQALLMYPMVDGELDRGVQLPLLISLAPQDGENY